VLLQALLGELVDQRLARMDEAERVNEAFAQWLLQGVEERASPAEPPTPQAC